MKRRKDPPNYPGDEAIVRRFVELKDMAAANKGLSAAELDQEMKANYEKAVREYAPIRHAIGKLFRAKRELAGMTRLELADKSNVPAKEIGRIERGVSDFCLGDMMKLCLALQYDLEVMMEDVNASADDLSKPNGLGK